MKNENIIIALIFLVIVALFAFSFNGITGLAPKTLDNYEPDIKISKTTYPTNEIRAGEKINVEIKINKGCVLPEFQIYSVENGIIKFRKTTIKYNPGIDECQRPSSEGAKIHCTGFKYCQSDLIADTIKKIVKTHSDWSGDYIVRVFYYDKKGKKASADSEEFKIVS